MTPPKFESLPCDLCGSDESVEVPYCKLYTNGQAVDICNNCGFVYVRNRRSVQDIADSWSDDIYGDGYTARIPAVKARQTYVADFADVTLGLKGKKLCDIGTGEGQFLEIARDQYGAVVFGTEASARNCSLLKAHGFDHSLGTIEDYLTSAKHREYRANIVTIMWTLENCRSCRDMLNAAYEILEPGGHIVVATGSRILVPFKKPLHEYLTSNPADSHSFRFSVNTLSGLLAVSGFGSLKVNRHLDSDVLCVIGQKTAKDKEIPWVKDDYLKVHNFFERWHHESIHYR